MSYIKLHGGHIKLIGGTFYARTRDNRKGATNTNSSEWTVHTFHVYGLDKTPANGLYNHFINGLDLQYINVCPCVVCGLYELFVTGLKRLPVNGFPHDVRKSVDATPDSDLTGMNGIGTEYSLNGLNELNGLGTESSQ